MTITPTFRATEHFDRLHLEGRKRPPPSIGSPTFVWHIGIWRKNDLHIEASGPKSDGNARVGSSGTRPYIDGRVERNKKFLAEISEFIEALQSKGSSGLEQAERRSTIEPSDIILEDVSGGGATGEYFRFQSYQPHSHTFVMWWRDKPSSIADHGKLNHVASVNRDGDCMTPGSHRPILDGDPDGDAALRVVVQTQVYVDYASISIYIDGAKRRSGKQIHAINEGRLGNRREQFAQGLDSIRKRAFDETTSGRVDKPSSQSVKASIEADADIKDATSYLFDGIWEEFQNDFGFQLASKGHEKFENGVVFVNHRGLLMSVGGLNTEADAVRELSISRLQELNQIHEVRAHHDGAQHPWVPSSRGASATIGPPARFDGTVNEPAAVLKSMWPMLAHMEKQAGSVDWVGCGILENKALFASSLGARPTDNAALDPYVNRGTRFPATTRFVVFSKGEPHRKQIGRFVDRILSLETMRVLALKHIGSIQNAHQYIEKVTHHLDDVRRNWSSERARLEESHPQTAGDDGIAIDVHKLGSRRARELLRRREAYYGRLSDLNSRVETQLILIGAELERMGPGGSGHLENSIARSRFLIARFRKLLETLEIENVDGWINYRQFAQRSLGPTFDTIEATGNRLAAAQDRLKSLTDVVQVSALIVQSEATRKNTDQLREISRGFASLFWVQFSVVAISLTGYAVLAAIFYALALSIPELSGWSQTVDNWFEWFVSGLGY